MIYNKLKLIAMICILTILGACETLAVDNRSYIVKRLIQIGEEEEVAKCFDNNINSVLSANDYKKVEDILAGLLSEQDFKIRLKDINLNDIGVSSVMVSEYLECKLKKYND